LLYLKKTTPRTVKHHKPTKPTTAFYGHIRMKLNKSGIPEKNLDKNDDFVYSIPLFCCRFFFSE
jgi:hypothetical protein